MWGRHAQACRAAMSYLLIFCDLLGERRPSDYCGGRQVASVGKKGLHFWIAASGICTLTGPGAFATSVLW